MALSRTTANLSSNLRPPAAWPIGIVLGLAFALPTYTYALTQTDYMTAASIGIFVPIVLWLAVVAIGTGAALQRGFFLAGAIVLPLFASMLIHVTDYGPGEFERTMVRAVACGLYVLVATFLVVHPRRDDVTRIAFGVGGLALAALFVVLAVMEPVDHWGRLQPGNLHPNWWGELFVVIAIGAALARPRWAFYGALPFIFVGLFLVQARGALLTTAILVAFAILAREGFRRLLVIGLVMGLVGLPVVLAVDALLLGGSLVGGLADFIANDVLRLNDPRRGLGTGFTGRTEGYQIAWAQFVQNPMFGVGFGLGNEVTLEADAGMIHNGHLQLLLELGLLLYPAIFVVMVGALVRSLVQGRWSVHGVVLAYVFFVLFSPRSINSSALSMASWFMIVYAWLLPATTAASEATLTNARRLGERWQTGAPAGRAGAVAQSSRDARPAGDGLPMPV